jgi:hypothetical protein
MLKKEFRFLVNPLPGLRFEWLCLSADPEQQPFTTRKTDLRFEFGTSFAYYESSGTVTCMVSPEPTINILYPIPNTVLRILDLVGRAQKQIGGFYRESQTNTHRHLLCNCLRRRCLLWRKLLSIAGETRLYPNPIHRATNHAYHRVEPTTHGRGTLAHRCGAHNTALPTDIRGDST